MSSAVWACAVVSAFTVVRNAAGGRQKGTSKAASLLEAEVEPHPGMKERTRSLEQEMKSAN